MIVTDFLPFVIAIRESESCHDSQDSNIPLDDNKATLGTLKRLPHSPCVISDVQMSAMSDLNKKGQRTSGFRIAHLWCSMGLMVDVWTSVG